MSAELPPLPCHMDGESIYSGAEMQAYARAAVEAERERWAGDARLAAYIREHAEQSADGWRVDVWINGSPSQQTIDEAIRQRGKQ